MASTETIPVIDLGPYLAGEPGTLDRTAKELRFALTEIGFYFIVNHGVPRKKIRAAFEQVKRFHAQPVEKKLALKIDPHSTGYLPMRGNTLRTSTVQAGTKPNLNEAFFVKRELPPDHPDVLSNRRFRGLNRWPDLPGFRETILDYNETLERLVQNLVRVYARAPFHVRPGGPGLVLGYGAVPPEAAERGVRLLADAVRAITGPPAGPRRARVHLVDGASACAGSVVPP